MQRGVGQSRQSRAKLKVLCVLQFYCTGVVIIASLLWFTLVYLSW